MKLLRLRQAIDQRMDAVLMGTPDVLEASERALNMALENAEQRIADLSARLDEMEERK